MSLERRLRRQIRRKFKTTHRCILKNPNKVFEVPRVEPGVWSRLATDKYSANPFYRSNRSICPRRGATVGS